MGLWFAVFPTVETLVAQVIAAVLVIGSDFAARRFKGHPTDGDAVRRRAHHGCNQRVGSDGKSAAAIVVPTCLVHRADAERGVY